MSATVEQAVARIRAWGEARAWRGWDPYDGLNSPAAPVLTLGTSIGRRALTQAVKLSPINLRPALGIRPAYNAKAIGLVASGYARLAAGGAGSAARLEAERWFEWLVAHPAETDRGVAWGYHFPVQTRVFGYARNAPNAIATSFVAQALLDGCELLGQERWRPTVGAAVEYVTVNLRHARHFTYLEGETELVHNANLLVCAVVARAARVLDQPGLLEQVRPALAATLAQQRPDGSWPYADHPGHDWVDNFHTAYVLEALSECARSLPEAVEPLSRGVEQWRTQMFLPDGRPKYYVDRPWPLDAHCYATGVDTWVALAGRVDAAREHAERLSTLLIEDLLTPAGFVRFQRRRRWSNNLPMIRWSTAPAFKALAGVMLLRRRSANLA